MSICLLCTGFRAELLWFRVGDTPWSTAPLGPNPEARIAQPTKARNPQRFWILCSFASCTTFKGFKGSPRNMQVARGRELLSMLGCGREAGVHLLSGGGRTVPFGGTLLRVVAGSRGWHVMFKGPSLGQVPKEKVFSIFELGKILRHIMQPATFKEPCAKAASRVHGVHAAP